VARVQYHERLLHPGDLALASERDHQPEAASVGDGVELVRVTRLELDAHVGAAAGGGRGGVGEGLPFDRAEVGRDVGALEVHLQRRHRLVPVRRVAHRRGQTQFQALGVAGQPPHGPEHRARLHHQHRVLLGQERDAGAQRLGDRLDRDVDLAVHHERAAAPDHASVQPQRCRGTGSCALREDGDL